MRWRVHLSIVFAMAALASCGASTKRSVTNRVRLVMAPAVTLPRGSMSVAEIASATPVAPLPASTNSIPMAAMARGVDLESVPDIAAVAHASRLDPDAAATVYAIASAPALDEQDLAEIAALAFAKGMDPATLKPVLALAFANSGLASRFDMLSPSTFSTLWYIKMKGKAAEARGENTDELWRRYWKVFESAAIRER